MSSAFYKAVSYVVILLIAALFLASCQSVKPYQRVYLNDHFMKMGIKPSGMFSSKVLVYREGSSGGGAGKHSGGCGCN